MEPVKKYLLAFTMIALEVAMAQQIQLQSWGANSIRIRIAVPGAQISDPIINGLLDAPPGQVMDAVRGSVGSGVSLSLSNGNVRVEADPTTGYVTVQRVDDGAILLKQIGLTWGSAPAGVRAGSQSALITFSGVNASERIVGFGGQQDGRVVKPLPFMRSIEASEYYPYNQGRQALVPYWSSTAGYSVLINMPSYGYFSVDTIDTTFFSNSTLCVDFWVSTVPTGFPRGNGASLPPLLMQYADAVGHAPPVPYFATGFIQSKDRYRNQSQLLDVARGYVTRGLPMSMIVIDWLHWVELGDMSLNPLCWPEPQSMVDELKSMGVELMVTFWPFMNSSSINFPAFTQQGFLARNRTSDTPDMFWYCESCDNNGGALVDSTSPYARQAIFDRFWSGYGSLGIKAVWLDETEPDRDGYTYGDWQLAAGADYEMGAGWKKTWIKTMADGFASKGIMPGDFFLLSRSFWLGTQQYGNTHWSGDLDSDWSDFALQVQSGQGAGMSGQGMWTTDIGGYNGAGGNPASTDFQELITRWFQFSAFSPVMRLHGHRSGAETPPLEPSCWQTHGDNEIWNLVPDQSDQYNAIVAVMRLREDLREYVSGINAEYSSTGLPLMRSMLMVCPDEAGCNDVQAEDQYMFGPDWCVGPVTQPMATAQTRSVYLPSLAGTAFTWVHWWSQTNVGIGGDRITWAWNGTFVDFPLYKRTFTS